MFLLEEMFNSISTAPRTSLVLLGAIIPLAAGAKSCRAVDAVDNLRGASAENNSSAVVDSKDLTDHSASSRTERITYLMVFLATLILYVMTLAPSNIWGDSTKMLFYVLEKKFVGLGSGFGTHPLHNLLGYAFSLLPVSFAYSQNLLSAFFAAAAICVTYGIVLESVRDSRAALAASTSLAVSHIFWLYAVINETYSLLAFSILFAMLLSLKWTRQQKNWHMFLLGFVLGAGLANHAAMLLALPGLLFLLWGKQFFTFCVSWKIVVVLLAFLLGSSQILVIPVIESGSILSFVANLTADTTGTYKIYSGSFTKFLRELSAYPLYLFYQFPGFAVLLGGIGGVVGLRHFDRLVVSSVVIATPILLFAAQYMKQRQFPMMLPTFCMFALWIGFGARYVLVRSLALRTLSSSCMLLACLALFPPLLYWAAAHIAEAVHYDVSFIRSQPYRNSYLYYLFPPKQHEHGPQRYVEDAFAQAKPGSTILSDFVPGLVLVYEQRVLGKRKDLEIDVFIDDWVHHAPDLSSAILTFIRSHVGANRNALYLADDWEAYYRSSDIRKEFDLVQTGGPLWEVIPR
jgi:hypothetical protein